MPQFNSCTKFAFPPVVYSRVYRPNLNTWELHFWSVLYALPHSSFTLPSTKPLRSITCQLCTAFKPGCGGEPYQLREQVAFHWGIPFTHHTLASDYCFTQPHNTDTELESKHLWPIWPSSTYRRKSVCDFTTKNDLKWPRSAQSGHKPPFHTQ